MHLSKNLSVSGLISSMSSTVCYFTTCTGMQTPTTPSTNRCQSQSHELKLYMIQPKFPSSVLPPCRPVYRVLRRFAGPSSYVSCYDQASSGLSSVPFFSCYYNTASYVYVRFESALRVSARSCAHPVSALLTQNLTVLSIRTHQHTAVIFSQLLYRCLHFRASTKSFSACATSIRKMHMLVKLYVF